MSVADCRSARRKMRLRYGGARKGRTVSESIADERRKAARQAAVKMAKKVK